MDYQKAWEELKEEVEKYQKISYRSLNCESGSAMVMAYQYVLDFMKEKEKENEIHE